MWKCQKMSVVDIMIAKCWRKNFNCSGWVNIKDSAVFEVPLTGKCALDEKTATGDFRFIFFTGILYRFAFLQVLYNFICIFVLFRLYIYIQRWLRSTRKNASGDFCSKRIRESLKPVGSFFF